MIFLIALLVVVVLFALPNPNRIGDETKKHFVPAHKGSGTRLLFQQAGHAEKHSGEIPVGGNDRAHFGGE